MIDALETGHTTTRIFSFDVLSKELDIFNVQAAHRRMFLANCT